MGELVFLLPELNPQGYSFSLFLLLFSGGAPWLSRPATCSQPVHAAELGGHLSYRQTVIQMADGGCHSPWQIFSA